MKNMQCIEPLYQFQVLDFETGGKKLLHFFSPTTSLTTKSLGERPYMIVARFSSSYTIFFSMFPLPIFLVPFDFFLPIS